jgi:ABC-2 type transport system permease protein
MAEIESLCSAVTILRHGSVVFSGSLEELRRKSPASAHRLWTSDDGAARALGSVEGVDVTAPEDAGAAEQSGIDLRATREALDRYVLALGRAGIAVRRLEPQDASLEALFLRLTREDAEPPAPAASPSRPAPEPEPPTPPRFTLSAGGATSVLAAEAYKLRHQPKVWATLAACVCAPFAFAVAMRLESILPSDTLFGRWVKVSGFAIPLVVLGFAGAWAFPVLTSIVGGDLFSAEDRYGTWPTLLTRSRTRDEIFAGKVLAALAFSLLSVCILALSSVTAGWVAVGREPLLGLSGTQIPSGRALLLVALAWASTLPPVFAFTGLSIFFSVATRSSAAGVGLPVLTGLMMELFSVLNGPYAIHRMLLTPHFAAWHGLFAEPHYDGPIRAATVTSLVYFIACICAAYALQRRREPT